MIDVPTEMMTSASNPYLDFPSPVAGGFQGDAPIEGGGGGDGGVDYLVGQNQWDLARDHRAIQSNGYVLIDYDGDHHYDQAWYLMVASGTQAPAAVIGLWMMAQRTNY